MIAPLFVKTNINYPSSKSVLHRAIRVALAAGRDGGVYFDLKALCGATEDSNIIAFDLKHVDSSDEKCEVCFEAHEGRTS